MSNTTGRTMYQVQGLVDGQWRWQHVADSEAAATFETEEEAAEAVRELCSDCVGFDTERVRYVAM